MNEPPRFFVQNNPNLKPRDEVRIETLDARLGPDGRRIKVQITVTPFREQPNFEIVLYGDTERILGGTTVVAAMNFRLEFTLHLRVVPDPGSEVRVRADLYYDSPSAPVHRAETTVRIPPAPAP